MSFYFETTVKGGLPVIAEVERENGYCYVTGLYWKSRKPCRVHGAHVPDSVYAAAMRDIDALNREADYMSQWEY